MMFLFHISRPPWPVGGEVSETTELLRRVGRMETELACHGSETHVQGGVAQ